MFFASPFPRPLSCCLPETFTFRCIVHGRLFRAAKCCKKLPQALERSLLLVKFCSLLLFGGGIMEAWFFGDRAVNNGALLWAVNMTKFVSA